MTTAPGMTFEEMATLHARAFPPDRAWSAADLEQLSAPPYGHVITHSDAGFLIARLMFDEAELLTICTDPAQQRRGIARSLLTQLYATCAAQTVTRIFLEVGRTNVSAVGLYTAEGFEKISERRAYYTSASGHRDDALILCKSL